MPDIETFVATSIGKGSTIEKAVSEAEEIFRQANNPGAESGVVDIGISVQTLWVEQEQLFYHIISYALKFV